MKIGTDVYPAMTIDGQTFLAADTDGDGIADSLLCPLPIGTPDGITYYVAIRILDNNSAINAAIAWKHNDDSIGILPGDFFPTNVNLQSILAGGAAEMGLLNAYRFNALGAGLQPVDDAGNARNDFAFISPYDALWQQLGRRPGNPGFNTASNRYRALSSADAAALAYRFMIRNPKMSPAMVEQCLSTSLVTNIPSQPFTPDQVPAWAAYFNYANANFDRKPLMTAGNPTSNIIQPASINGPSNPTVANPAMLAYQGPAPKASINTAAFPELFRAFWSVAAHTCGAGTFTTYFGNSTNTSFNPYSTDPALNPQRMFRSSIRRCPTLLEPSTSPPGALIPPSKPSSALPSPPSTPSIFATPIPGSPAEPSASTPPPPPAPQQPPQPPPSMSPSTAASANRSSPKSTAKPTPPPSPQAQPAQTPKAMSPSSSSTPTTCPLTLDSTWNIAILDRSKFPDVPVTALSPAPFTTPITIPASGYLVLENYDPKNSDAFAAKYRPFGSGLNFSARQA